MPIKVRFPVGRGSRNHKAIREAVLLDTTGNSYEERIFAAAERAASEGQKVYVTRSYGPAGRFGVVIADDRATERKRANGKYGKSGTGTRMDRRKALQAALGRFTL